MKLLSNIEGGRGNMKKITLTILFCLLVSYAMPLVVVAQSEDSFGESLIPEVSTIDEESLELNETEMIVEAPSLNESYQVDDRTVEEGSDEQSLESRSSPQQMNSGFWGEVTWAFEEESGTLTLNAGIASNVNVAPWKLGVLLPEDVFKIVVNGTVVLPENSSELFQDFINLRQIIGGNNFDVSNVTNMTAMFAGNTSLVEINVSNWDTSNVITMASMFSNVQQLETLDVSNWDVSRVSNMTRVFSNMHALKSLDVNNWNVSNVTNMSGMFYGLSRIESLDLSNWNTTKVTNMSVLFTNMLSLNKLDLSSFNTSNVQTLTGLFSGTPNLSHLTLGTQSKFTSSALLPAIPRTETHSGRWLLQGNPDVTFQDSSSFMEQFDGSHPGVYIRELALTAEVVPQTIILGDSIDVIDLSAAIPVVSTGGSVLGREEYSIATVDSSPHLYIGDRFKAVAITHLATGSRIIVEVPISVRWGNTIRLRGTWANNFDEWRTVAAFTHHVGENGPELSFSPGRGGSNPSTPMIQQLPNQEFSSLRAYSGTTGVLLNQGEHFFDFAMTTQQTPEQAEQAFEDINEGNGRLKLNIGDVVSATHLFSTGEELSGALAGFSNKEWNVLMQDEPEENTGTDHTNKKNTAFYEVTQTNLRPLVINQLRLLSDNRIWQFTSQEELMEQVESFFDFDIAEGKVSIAEIIEMPDTSQVGDATMVVRVQEQLTTGQYAQIDYTVPVSVLPLQVEPKDPENPQAEIQPEIMPELPEQQGALSIDFVPTFQFGNQSVTYLDYETLYADPLTTVSDGDRANFVQISDRRGSTQSDGWQLSVKQREQFKDRNTNQILNGTSLEFRNIQAITNTDQENGPTYSESVKLIPGVSSSLACAKPGSGLETWLLVFGTTEQAAESVALHLHSGQERQSGTYKTTLEWTLQSVPDNKMP